MALQERVIYRFGRFELDATARVLCHDGTPVPLAPKTAETLHVLLEHADVVLTKEDLLRALWPSRVVEEVNLTQQISLLRRALAAREEGLEYVRNFPGRGYQFMQAVTKVAPAVAEVAVEQAVAPLPVVSAPRRRFPRWVGVASVAGLTVLVGAAILLKTRPGSPAAEPPRRVPFSRLPGSKSHPAINADGTRVAFVWDRADGQGACIWVKAEDQEAPVQIPGTCGTPSSPAWSPDGHQLAWIRNLPASTELVVYREFAGERVLTNFSPVRSLISNRLVAWSPDGRWIAVSGKPDPEAPMAVYLVSVENGERRQATHPGALTVGDTDPTFSPDGRVLAFVRLPSRFTASLLRVAVSGGGEVPLVEADPQIGGVAWGNAGILFSSNRDGSFRLWRVDRNGKNVRPDSAGVAGENALQFSLSAPSHRLVYVFSGDDLNIWRLRLPQLKGSQPEWTRLIASTGIDASPQYSPDGKHVCFLSDRSGSEQIWVANTDGSAPRQLTRGHLLPGHPGWTPDGQGVLFTTHSPDEAGRIYIAPLGNGGMKRVGGELEGSLPLMPASGDRLYLVHQSDGRHNLYRYPLAGGGPAVQLTTLGAHRARPGPDGKTVYFVRSRTSTEIWRLGPDDRGETLVLSGLIPGYFGFWTPAREGIYYLGEDAGAPVLYLRRYGSAGAEPVTRIPAPLPPLGLAELSISPDGHDLVMVRRESSSSDLVALHGID